MSDQAVGTLIVPSVPRSVSLIREFAVAACAKVGAAGVCDTMALLVSEVATNALVHGAGDVQVRILPNDGGVRVEVSDDGHGVPVVRGPSLDAEGGRGMALVDALASDWGFQSTAAGKPVWFTVATDR